VFCGVAIAWCGLAGAALGQEARSADAFIDSIGVNTHTFFGGTAYEDYTWREKLLASGIRHIRENLQRDNPTQVRRINDLYEAGGIRTSFIFDPRADRGGTVAELFARLKGSMLAAAEQVEGPNEYENAHVADWDAVAQDARAYQARLYATIKGDPATAQLPVLGPSVAYPSGYGAWGDVSASLDIGNMHSYPGGRKPSANLREWLAAAATTSATKPVEATETGYHNAVTTSGGHLPASERAAGIYLPRLYLEYFRRGVRRTYAYELVSEGPDESDAEQNFGLLRSDYSDKPAMVALRNLIALLDDRPSPFTWCWALTPSSFETSTGDSLSYSLLDAPPEVHHVLLQARDGAFWLALWREVPVWDPLTRADRNRSDVPVNLALEEPVASASTYLPNLDTSPLATWSSPKTLTLRVGPMVTLLEIRRSATAAGTEAAPEAGADDVLGTPDATTDATPIDAGPSPTP